VGKYDYQASLRLPPLPRVEPLPPGPFSPFSINTFAPSHQASQDFFSTRTAWPAIDYGVSPPSPASSVDIPLWETFPIQKTFGQANALSGVEIMALVAPKDIQRKPPLQLCGRKRKEIMLLRDSDDQKEKHRLAEVNRRKNLSQLLRELDSRVHDFFLEKAGWKPIKGIPQSKEHIVQGAIFLIDFMLVIIVHLLGQEKQISPQFSEKLQSHLRCLQLQHHLSDLQRQNQTVSQQLETLRQENETLAERNRALEFQLESYDHTTTNMFHSLKREAVGSPPLAIISDESA
jgi:cell division protein FtsB